MQFAIFVQSDKMVHDVQYSFDKKGNNWYAGLLFLTKTICKKYQLLDEDQ